MTEKTPVVETELSKLKKKCLKADGSPKANASAADLKRLKVLIDGQQLTAAEIKEAQEREEKRQAEEVAAFKARKEKEAKAAAAGQTVASPDPALDKPEVEQPQEHPRIVALKKALEPFTMLEADESRPDEFILVVRGGKITAGDVRTARRVMKI